MVVQVFVAQRQAIHPLGHQLPYAVFDTLGIAVIGKTIGQAIEQSNAPIHLAQQQPTTVRCDAPAVKTPDHLASTQGLKFQLFRFTLCIHRPLSLVAGKCLVALALCNKKRPISRGVVRNPG